MRNKVNFLQLAFYFLGVIALGAITGCNKEPMYTPVSFKSTEISDFWLEKTSSNPTINRPYQAMISGDTIRLLVDYGTNITSLEPTIFADADSIYPTGKQNFSNPVQYRLWANGQTATYTVRITVSQIQNPVITSIAAGFDHIMAVKNDGTVWVCGSNESGQLGLGDYSGRVRLTQVPVYNAEKIYTGGAATFIRLKDGSVWGSGNQYGQLGLGNKNPISILTRVPFLDNATDIGITFTEVIALKADGTIWGAGRNASRILAQGDGDLRATFVKIPIANVKTLSVNFENIIVQKTNGEVWGWGINHVGQLGLGDKVRREMPTLLPTPSVGIVEAIAGAGNTFLIDSNGRIWAVGANAAGQLGLGDITNRSLFTPISFFDDKAIDRIISRNRGTGFMDTNGNVWNVGDNVRGQIGIGSKAIQVYTTPVQLSGFTATTLTGFGDTVFALKPDGTLWAWGSNSSGVLGTGTDVTDVSSPIQIK